MSEYGREDWSKITANPIIDWGKLTSNYESVLSAQEESRVAQRQKIDEDASAGIKNVQDYSAGNNQNINTALFGASNAATSLIKSQYDLVKKGQADPRQFQLTLKNAQDSFTNLKKVGDTWNQRALELEKRTNAHDNSVLEIDFAKLDGGLAQFKNVKFIPDATGTMYAYRIKDDGSVDAAYPPTSADALLNPANTKVDIVKVDAETAPIAKNIADWTININKTLGTSLEDARNHSQYKSFVDGAANNILSTDIRTASVLADSLHLDRVYTEEEHKKNPNAIYIKSVDGVRTPQITDEQRKMASDYVKATLDAQVKHIESQKFEPQVPKVVAPKEGKNEKPEDKPSIGEVAYIVKGGKDRGKTVGVSNVKSKEASGVERTIDAFGVYDGNVFVKYTQYDTRENIKGKDGSSTQKIGENHYVSSNEAKDKVDSLLRLVPNPETGRNFNSAQEARQYIEANTAKTKAPTQSTNKKSTPEQKVSKGGIEFTVE